MTRLYFFSFFLVFFSCTEDTVVSNFGNKEFLDMARAGDPKLKLIIPKSISEAIVDCGEYTPPCRYGMKAIIKKIELKALFYDHQEDALKAAKRIKGYISRNWVLDDVAGEPILERFVVKYLEAKKALLVSQPKK